jgi:hypothetical protein
MNPEFLAGLNEIDWASLGYPDIPKWLSNLASDDRELRIEAYNSIEDLIANSGSDSWENYGPISVLLRTDIPLYITPFLIELLQTSKTLHKDSILQLIYDLAMYPRLIKSSNDEVFRSRAESVFEEVKKGVPTYKILLSDTNTSVQQGAQSVLDLIVY